MSSKNAEIKSAIDTFDIDTARSLLREALKEANAETYYLASLVALDNVQKKDFLQKALELDPFHEKAHSALKGNENTKAVTDVGPSKISKVAEFDTSIVSSDLSRFILATLEGINGLITMYTIPIETGLVRTQITKGSKVLLIERDERAEWFLCGYISPVGQAIVGWIAKDNLSEINLNGNEINVLDLPITRFEPYNNRAQVQKLIQEKKKKLKSINKLTIESIITGIIASVILIIGALILPLGEYYSSAIAFALFLLVMGFGLAFKSQKFWKQRKSNQIFNAPYIEEQNRLDLLQKDMRNEYEKLRDDQRFTMGIQAGLDTAKNLVGIAGDTVAKKILTSSPSTRKKK